METIYTSKEIKEMMQTENRKEGLIHQATLSSFLLQHIHDSQGAIA